MLNEIKIYTEFLIRYLARKGVNAQIIGWIKDAHKEYIKGFSK